jgi:hypothetical protein
MIEIQELAHTITNPEMLGCVLFSVWTYILGSALNFVDGSWKY